MTLFQNERFLRVLRPTATILGLVAAAWHSTHALSMWRQTQQYKASDPPASAFFWSQFQMELGVTAAAFFAGVFAWQLFRPRPKA